MVMFFVVIMTGCGPGDGLNRQAMYGLVTVDGQRLAGRAILFEPQSRASGTAVGATIRRGSFGNFQESGSGTRNLSRPNLCQFGQTGAGRERSDGAYTASDDRGSARAVQHAVQASR